MNLESDITDEKRVSFVEVGWDADFVAAHGDARDGENEQVIGHVSTIQHVLQGNQFGPFNLNNRRWEIIAVQIREENHSVFWHKLNKRTVLNE